MDKSFTGVLQRFRSSEVILIGGSAGSFNPVFGIIKALPADFKPAVVVVIHRGRNNYSEITHLFGDNCRMLVCEIADKDEVVGNKVYVAPKNYHTLFENDKTFALDVSDPVWYSKPSIDVTFESAADTYQKKCSAILFSGANQDGAAGLLKLHGAGALTIVQNPAEAEMAMMPQAAVDIGAMDIILGNDDILKLFTST